MAGASLGWHAGLVTSACVVPAPAAEAQRAAELLLAHQRWHVQCRSCWPELPTEASWPLHPRLLSRLCASLISLCRLHACRYGGVVYRENVALKSDWYVFSIPDITAALKQAATVKQ